MGFLFKCDVCTPSNFQTEYYNQWLEHLHSKGHQTKAKSHGKRQPRNQWANEKDSFVLIGINNGLPCPEEDLLQWISKHGIITEYINHKNFILFSLTTVMPGNSSTSTIVKEAIPFGRNLVIKPKSQVGSKEWNALLNPGGNDNQLNNGQVGANIRPTVNEPHSSRSSSDGGSVRVNPSAGKVMQHQTSAKKVKNKQQHPLVAITGQSLYEGGPPKNTLVFTNSNKSSAQANQNSAKKVAESVTSNVSLSSSTSDCTSERSSKGSSSNKGKLNNVPMNAQKQKPGTFTAQNQGSSPSLRSQSQKSSNVSNVAVAGSIGNIAKANHEVSKVSPASDGGGKKKKRSRQRNKVPPLDGIVELSPFPNRERGVLEQRGKKSTVVTSPSVISFSKVNTNNVGIKPEGSSTGPSQQQQKQLTEPVPEPLNFRGGFNLPGRNRLDSQRISESSDFPTLGSSTSQVNNHPQPPVKPLNQTPKEKNKKGKGSPAKNNPAKMQTGPQPKFQILQRPPPPPGQAPLLSGPPPPQNTNQVPYMHQTQAHFNPWPHPHHGQRHHQPQAFFGPRTGAPVPLIAVAPNMVPAHRAPYVPSIPFISPTFASQLPDVVASDLSNPFLPRSKNPYNFSVNSTPPFPYYFELFQKLPDESFKPNKFPRFREFSQLPLSQQLDQFFLALSLPYSEVLLRWQVVLDILILIREHFPRCELYAFGSIITGLGDFSSDIDIYVDLVGESTSPAPVHPSEKIPSHEAVDRVKRILRRSLCPHNKNGFVKNLIPVKSARVPILKLTHRATDINCDLSFENRLSVRNTKMLAFYLDLDPYIFRFMVLIRYWGKFHHITGSNHIKNYALALLVLVYLCKRGLVPPLVLLQKLKQAEREQKRVQNSDEIDGWDSSFCDNMITVRSAGFNPVEFPGSDNGKGSQAQVLIQMAIEFFDMYANIDFSDFVVCSLLGDILPKKMFEPGNEESLPESLDRYKNWAVKQEMNRRLNINSCFCVQDPFVLSFNVGCVTPLGTLLKFQLACAKTKHILATRDLKSLLDVLTPLPEHIGEKKFMKVLKSEQMAEDLMNEIKEKVGVLPSKQEINQPQSQSNQSSVKLPFPIPEHLKKFDRLIDEKSMKAALKRGKWETFIDFNLSSEFESLFITELSRCGIRESKKISSLDITYSMCGLWKEFALDFLQTIFEVSLNFNIREKMSNFVESPKGNASGRKSKWKVRSLTKKEEEKIKPTEKSINEQHELFKKIRDFKVFPLVINYEIWDIEIPYPFWDKRPTHNQEAGKKMAEEGEIIRIPVIPTSKEIRKEEKEKRRKKGKEKEVVGVESKTSLKVCFDPTELERRTSEDLQRRLEKLRSQGQGSANGFNPFRFNVLVKLDVSSISDRPQIFFMFEKHSSMKKTTTEYERALTTLSNILNDSFPTYQVYRLVKWLDVMPSSDLSTLPNIPGLKSEEEEVAESSPQDAEAGSGEKKRKTRSKLEEDLLIPSSSSSTCSSNPDLNDIADDDVVEEEDQVSQGDGQESDEEAEVKGEPDIDESNATKEEAKKEMGKANEGDGTTESRAEVKANAGVEDKVLSEAQVVVEAKESSESQNNNNVAPVSEPEKKGEETKDTEGTNPE